MKVLPVLDLRAGLVVRGIAGRRQDYRPLTPECHPTWVARFFREQFGLEELYIADLDAFAGKPPALDLFGDLRKIGFQLWVDAGVSDASSAEPLFAAGIETVVVGLETVAGPSALEALCMPIPRGLSSRSI
jgi:phosphoribosylformimino-5-aminoimidazole carboxamide ribotide isomerase